MAMRKLVSFIAKFANSFCNRQANLPPAFATSTPERFHRPSALAFCDGKPPPLIFSRPSRLLSWARIGVALGPMRAKSSTQIFAIRAGRDVSSADRAARSHTASAALNLLAFLGSRF